MKTPLPLAAILMFALVEPSFAFDTTSPLPNPIPKKQEDFYWDAYRQIGTCMSQRQPEYPKSALSGLKLLDKSAIMSSKWSHVFPDGSELKACRTGASGKKLKPMLRLAIPKLYKDQGQSKNTVEVDTAISWFSSHSTKARYEGDGVARELLKETLLSWADANAIRSYRSNIPNAVDFKFLTLVGAIMNATSEIAPDLSDEERKRLTPWLARLAGLVVSARFQYRQDNKSYHAAEIVLVWSIMVGDDKTTQSVIDVYKQAISDMRPDGSFPIDSSRGGMGITYQAHSTSHLVMIAAILKKSKGVDLFKYTIDGRSIQDAVGFVVASIKEPGVTNSKYAVSCPNAGDYWGSVSGPSIYFVKDRAAFLTVYDAVSGDKSFHEWTRQRFWTMTHNAQMSEINGGAPACLMAVKPMKSP